jgi:hypothetical protein
MTLNHFQSLSLFALLASIGLACLTKRSPAAWAKYALGSFLLFLLISVAFAWIMYPFSR